MNEPAITCPRCGRTSWNLNDVRFGYCGHCHEFTAHSNEGNGMTNRYDEGYADGHAAGLAEAPEPVDLGPIRDVLTQIKGHRGVTGGGVQHAYANAATWLEDALHHYDEEPT